MNFEYWGKHKAIRISFLLSSKGEIADSFFVRAAQLELPKHINNIIVEQFLDSAIFFRIEKTFIPFDGKHGNECTYDARFEQIQSLNST